jgi:hypothetical protein
MHLIRFEHSRQPLASRPVFLRRLATNVAVALGLIAVSLLAGMAGYHFLGGLAWLDAFLNAAMILSGMGPVDILTSGGAKFFAGAYALYSGLLVVATSALILAPALHRVLHGLHVADDDDEKRAEKDKPTRSPGKPLQKPPENSAARGRK